MHIKSCLEAVSPEAPFRASAQKNHQTGQRSLHPPICELLFSPIVGFPVQRILKEMSANYNRVSVKDLLNEDSAQNSNESGCKKKKVNKNYNSQAKLCSIPSCNRKFVSQTALEAHQRRSHAPPTLHICGKCKSSFSNLPNLNKHVSHQLITM